MPFLRAATRCRHLGGPWCVVLAALILVSLSLSARAASANDWDLGERDLAAQSRLFLPTVMEGGNPGTGTCYQTIPVLPPPTDRPADSHADLNLDLRGFAITSANLGFASYGGPSDPNAPQMAGIFADNRTPRFTSVHRVYDWDWSCGPGGCRGALISSPPVTLLGMSTRPGESLAAPSRCAEMYPGGYRTLVIYAETGRITLKYTRNDNVIAGYSVHLEGVSVDPNLLALYRQANGAGRSVLPALRNGQPLGTATGNEIRVAVRDSGTFLDPRSRKDWWQGR